MYFLVLFLLGNNGYDKNKEFSYKLRMDADNTPITLENRNRFWFPGPNANFELNMRYHRGFIQIQHIIDQAIIKMVVEAENAIREQQWLLTSTTTTTTEETTVTKSTENKASSEDFSNESNSRSSLVKAEDEITRESIENNATEATSIFSESVPVDFSKTSNEETIVEEASVNKSIASNSESVETTTTTEQNLGRQKRQIDFGYLFGGSTTDEEPQFQGIDYENMHTYTKQFPYPKYRRDNFLTGLYLAQCIQLLFFFALIVQVSNAVRNRIWMRESGNSTVNDQINYTHKLIIQINYTSYRNILINYS